PPLGLVRTARAPELYALSLHDALPICAVRRVQEVGVGTLATAAHASAQLVQLAEAKLVGALHNQSIGVRDVQAGFYDGGAHQHRSEEHTSELQSREKLVCRRLLDKKTP